MTAIAEAPQAVVTRDRRGCQVPWSQWLHELTEHLNTYGMYPACGTTLGSWVSRQRTAFNRGVLPVAQAAQLEALPGWLWDARQDPWPASFDKLRTHLADHGRYPTTAHLKKWVAKQRETYASGHLSEERAGLLEELPGWSWETTAWGRSFDAYATHIKKTGRRPAHRTSLYFWASRQRIAYASGRLSAAQISQLEGVPGWLWNCREEIWLQRYQEVEKFVSAGGAYPRPRSDLGRWLDSQRQSYRLGSLSAESIARLEALPGWCWRLYLSWEEQFVGLSIYVADHGRLPAWSTSRGRWIRTQRAAYRAGRLSADQARRLESLPGWSWGPASTGRLAGRA